MADNEGKSWEEAVSGESVGTSWEDQVLANPPEEAAAEETVSSEEDDDGA